MDSKLTALRERYRDGGVTAAASAVAASVVGGCRRRLADLRRAPKAAKVDRWKQQRSDADLAYDHDPRVSFLIQWFNQRENVQRVAAGLPDDPAYETIVCEDGSVDGSLEAWDDQLTRRNDFLIRSNDLHEIRTYTRAAGLARGEFICLLQDDDTLPVDTDWIDATLALFESYPDLAVVCGQSGWGLQDIDPEFSFDPPDDRCPPELDDLLREGGGYKDERPEEVPSVAPEQGRPFVFVPCISVGPVFIRRRVFEELGGFDLAFSDPGQPGMGFEVDFALRCWEAGYRVGFTPMGLDRGAVGGTMTFSQQDRDDAHEQAWTKLRADHRDHFEEVAARVHEANADLAPREGAVEVAS